MTFDPPEGKAPLFLRAPGRVKEGEPRNVRRSTSRAPVYMVQAWHVIFLISGFFDSLFLADSGGEEQDDWLLG